MSLWAPPGLMSAASLVRAWIIQKMPGRIDAADAKNSPTVRVGILGSSWRHGFFVDCVAVAFTKSGLNLVGEDAMGLSLFECSGHVRESSSG